MFVPQHQARRFGGHDLGPASLKHKIELLPIFGRSEDCLGFTLVIRGSVSSSFHI